MRRAIKFLIAAIILSAPFISSESEINYFQNGKIPKKGSEKIKPIKIGAQTWMLENLNVFTYRNGDTIPQVQDPFEWSSLKTGAWCYYENISENGVLYGKLYNYFAVNDARGLAPLGWHIPTDAEWKILTDNLGGLDVAGEKMKSTSTWENKGNGTNESGFTGLPGGYRLTNGKYDSAGSFDYVGKFAYFWSAREQGSYNCWPRILSYNNKNIVRTINDKRGGGMSVRCVMD